MRFKELKVGTVGIQREEITEMDYVRKSKKKKKFRSPDEASCKKMYRVIINDCPIVVGVENPYKFWMYRQPRNVRQTSRQISTTAGSATY
jgi:hypothetical protein